MNPDTQNTAVDPWSGVESVETDMIKFEEVGKTVVGVLLDRKMTNTKFGESPLYKIMTAEAPNAAFFASGLLDDKLAGQIGKIVRIQFVETTPSTKGNDAKIYDVKALADTPENRAKVGLPTGDAEGSW